MTKIIRKEMYCKKCNKTFMQSVYMSVSSFMMSEEEKKKMKEGTIFKNFCPECGGELLFNESGEQK
jgi:hypothetical protein